MSCWSCQTAVAPEDAFCPACRKIQPLAASADPFAVLGLPRRYAVDAAELERRFRDLSRQLHPDRFARATPRERRLSLERTTRLNDAYRALRDDRRRAEVLLALGGHDPVAEGRTLQDPEFLEEQLDVRETLAEARACGDAATLQSLAVDARERLGRLLAEIAALFAEEEAGADRAAEIARRLARARYYDRVVGDVSEAAAPPVGPSARPGRT